MPARQVYELATAKGAEALGLSSGRIEVGRPADLVLLRPDLPEVLPSPDPASAMVYAMSPASVDSVWVDGQALVRGRRVLAWDWDETVAGVRASLARVRARAGR